MSKRLLRQLALCALLALPIVGCSQEETAGKPPAITMTETALGHYCQMYLLDHGGPKAQIHLRGFDQPLWFSQVSDAVAYLHDPEQLADVRAIYVNDMSKAPSWSEPGVDNWIDGDNATYVINSRQLGGMGVPEAIPFSSGDAAKAFAQKEGGIALRLGDIPEAYVRPPMSEDGVPVASISKDGEQEYGTAHE